MDFPNLMGLCGVILVLTCYLLLQMEKMTFNGWYYPIGNMIGSAFVLYSLCFHWNMASFYIEIIWLFISIFALIKKMFKTLKHRRLIFKSELG